MQNEIYDEKNGLTYMLLDSKNFAARIAKKWKSG